MNDKERQLQAVRDELGDCTRCKLHTTRTKIVFGEGSPSARVMFIGEGPGKDEDLQGRPFVGRAGQLLTSIIEKGMRLRREDVYIANVVKCRPTIDLAFFRDRPPDEEEATACGTFLIHQIEVIRPSVIITLGNPSTKFLLNTKLGITKIRGTWFDFRGIPVMPTYHPSYVLRNGGDSSPLKRDVWTDIQKVLDLLDRGASALPASAVPVKEPVKSYESLQDRAEAESEVQGKLF